MSQSFESYFDGKKVLVTGAAGFIGSHLCDRLLALGAEVLGVDNFLTGSARNIAHLYDADRDAPLHERFSFVQADVTKHPDAYLNSAYTPDLILHFASPASPPRYQYYPRETYRVNAQATDLLLGYLERTNPQGRFVFAGTSEAYGDPLEHPQKESYWGNVNPNGPRSCYDVAKRMGEAICGVYNRDYNLDTRIVRIFNTYGPRMDLLDGRVVPNLILQALTHEPFTIYGDGSQTRSYCYVTDLVDGIMRLAGTADLAGETINLGNPSEFSVLETAQVIHEVVVSVDSGVDGTRAEASTAAQPNYSYHPLPVDDPTRRKPDISKAQSLLDWQPSVSFRDGLLPTVAYFMTQVPEQHSGSKSK